MPDILERPLSRRDFLRVGVAAAGAALVSPWLWPRRWAQAAPTPSVPKSTATAIPTRPLGTTGTRVSILGLGGEGVLRTWNRPQEAAAVIRRALDHGITYCDTAPAYSGSQDYYGKALGEYRSRIFLASKTHDRSRDGSRRLLEASLKRLRTDHLDLWQLHNLRTQDDLDRIFGPRGAIKALEEARQEGLVRFLGITGHYDPQILAEALRRFPFDTALVALNAADRTRLSFIEQFLPAATHHHLGIIGMKVVARGRLLPPSGPLTMRQALGYVLGLPISTAIVGFQTPAEVDEAVAIAKAFEPFPEQERAHVEALATPYADEASFFKRAG